MCDLVAKNATFEKLQQLATKKKESSRKFAQKKRKLNEVGRKKRKIWAISHERERASGKQAGSN